MPKDFDVLFIPGGVGCIRNLENSSARDEILEGARSKHKEALG